MLVWAPAYRIHKLLGRLVRAWRDPRQVGHVLQRGPEAVDAQDDSLPVVRVSEVRSGRDDGVQLLRNGHPSSGQSTGAQVLSDRHGGCARQLPVVRIIWNHPGEAHLSEFPRLGLATGYGARCRRFP